MIKVEGVSKEFVNAKKYPGLKGAVKGLFSNEKERKLAVNDISFEIADGEMVGYIGGNGAGKSTTIKMMTGIIVPTSGIIEVDGIVPYKNRMQNAQNIGVVFGQRTQLWWNLPLGETFTILKEIYKVNDKDFKKRMKFLNEVLDLGKFMNNTVRTLSLGQRMRADLAASLLHNPKTLYLDEPTIGLDLVVKDKIRNAIKEINAKYHSKVILTTHDLTDIEEICHRILIIDKGTIIYDGTLENIKDKYGKTRMISVDLHDISVVKKINFNKIFNVSKKDFNYQIDGKTVTFIINKDRVSVSAVLSNLMGKTDVKDIRIKETDIGDIVKQIYIAGI
ncbi:MAG: ATP-binding cassette domain-containing protein [Lachnospiraceae bacterium]|nr:ATP-binding cassette domain-containing protein [Lachnospiraceae bacterium]